MPPPLDCCSESLLEAHPASRLMQAKKDELGEQYRNEVDRLRARLDHYRDESELHPNLR